MLEYVWRKMNLIYLDISSMSYERFTPNIEDVKNGKFEKLYSKFPMKSLEDGLRFIFKDSTVVDLLLY